MSVPDNHGERTLPVGAAPVHSTTDLSARITELSSAVDEAERDFVHAFERAEQLRAGVRHITGHGEAENGAVEVTVDAAGRLIDIDFTPTVFRIASIQRLRNAVKDAAADAADDAAAQYQVLAGIGPDGVPDPLGDFLGRMPEVTRLLPPELVNRLQGVSVVDTEERSGRLADRDLWEGPNPYEP